MSNVKTRAKFECIKRTEEKDGGFSFEFHAVVGNYSEEPESENAKFFKFTPSGFLSIGMTHDHGFEVGKEYYLDFSNAPVIEEATEDVTEE